MITVAAKAQPDTKAVAQQAQRTSFKSIQHAANSIRKTAIQSIKYTDEVIGYIHVTNRKGAKRLVKYYKPSPAGSTVHGHKKGGYFRKAIQYSLQPGGVFTPPDATIGFSHGVVGEGLRIHEHGGTKDGVGYPKRPIMAPALEANLDRFAKSFSGQLG